MTEEMSHFRLIIICLFVRDVRENEKRERWREVDIDMKRSLTKINRSFLRFIKNKLVLFLLSLNK